jgi:guanosine-3',5'-bis(diphosphate) 3'-pyrophosphohydrolase
MMSYQATIEEENKEIAKRYKDLLKGSYQTLSVTDKNLIRKAFDLSLEAHSKQRRKTGEPYIFHPIAVAKIVAYEIGLGAPSIAAALLHDVVEDTPYTVHDMEQFFGEKIAKIVSGLTKISRLNKTQDASIQAENFRKMLLTLNDDVRVILIKIADRLHNMQTMDAMPAHKQVKIASETLYIYAPLAHRLGLYNIKTTLEDLGLKYTESDVYKDISAKIIESKEEQDAYIETFSEKIRETLKDQNFKYTIKGRTKSIYSICRKMRAQNVRFDEVYDKFAIRIIYKSNEKNEKFDAWKIYSIVTEHYNPNPLRLRDWITNPKTTGYESLHITVMGPRGKWVEVQIRSERMDEIAEKGYAAHFKYKQGSSAESVLETWLDRLKDTLENKSLNAVDFVEDFKLNLYSEEIFVFTPNGDLKSLPKGASALDFAFAVHTDVGLRCRGALVNGKLTPLDTVLGSGDQVEIMISNTNKPNPRWLEFVVTARAKARIRAALKEEEKRIADEGKILLTRKLKYLKISLSENVVNELVSYFKLKTSFDLFYRMGASTIENFELKNFAAKRSNNLYKYLKNKIQKSSSQRPREESDELTQKYDLLVFGKDGERLEYTLSKCCNPIAGDKVFGFLTINDGIKVHKNNCPNAISMQSNYAYRVLPARWIDSSQRSFKVSLKISGEDKQGILNELTRIIYGNNKMNIYKINSTTRGSTFEGVITIDVRNKTQLQKLSENIKKIDGINKVSRMD